MKEKTLTLKEKSREGNYLLYSGETQKRKLGSWVTHKEDFLRPRNIEITPKVSIREGVQFRKGETPIVFANFYLEEPELYKFKNGEIGRYENKIGQVLGSDHSGGFDGIIFKRIGETDLDFKNPKVNGKDLISVYRTFELIDKSKKIPTEKEWHSYHAGEWAGQITILKSYADLNWSSLYNTFFEENQVPGEELIKKIKKKLKIPKKDFEYILNSYPLDDNKEEIKENDLVKLILK